MSIPIKDINAGDTVSSMVDKINYNFDLLSLKGGGPQGLQGIQGIRGSVGEQGVQGIQGIKGVGIMHGNGDPTGTIANEGDVYVDENTGIIYSYENNSWHIIFNPTESTESPFAWHPINGSTHTAIVKRENVPVILGGDTTIQEDIISSQTPINSSLNIYSDISEYNAISVFTPDYANHAFDLNINFNGNTTLKTRTDYNLVIGDFGNDFNGGYVILDSKLKLKGYINSGSHNGEYAIVTSDNQYGSVPSQSSKQWLIDIETSGALYPNSNYDIGKDANRIQNIYINPNSIIYSGSITAGSTSFPTIRSGNISSGKRIMGWSENGVSFGISSHNYYDNFLGDKTFGLLVGNCNSTSKKAPYIKIKPQVFGGSGESQDNYGNIEHISATALEYDSSTNDIKYNVVFAESSYYDMWNSGYISPIISVGGINSIPEKNIRRMLTVKGQDDRCGNDIMISGGDSFGESFINGDDRYNNVGGNVFIAGGGAVRGKTSSDVKTFVGDLRNFGNIIIGINPINHKRFTSNVYGSQRNGNNDEISATDPQDVKFFDVCDVAIHGNRIVIDSNANQRKTEKMASRSASFDAAFNKSSGIRYVTEPENATLQVSALNTIYRNKPIVVSAHSDSYYHQFLSGIMTYIVGAYYNSTSNKLEYFEVTEEEFKYLITKQINLISQDTEIRNKYRNSVYLVVHQTWQKVANVVNVSARCEWFAYRTGYTNAGAEGDMAQQGLHRITNNMSLINGISSNVYFDAQTKRYWWYEDNNHHCHPINSTLTALTAKEVSTNSVTKKYVSKSTFNPDGSGFGDFYKQPLTVIAMPFNIKNNTNMYCYGNGCILTEMFETSNQTYETLKNHQVFVGNDPFFNTNAYASTIPNNSAYHSKYGHISSGTLTDYEKLHFAGKGFTMSSDRWSGAADNNNRWCDYNFEKTTPFPSSNGYCYVFPSMMTNWHNQYNGNDNFNTMLRPVVGLYTAMNINYSYVLGSAFGDEFITFRKTQPSNTSPGIATQESEIRTITNEATEYASAI